MSFRDGETIKEHLAECRCFSSKKNVINKISL